VNTTIDNNIGMQKIKIPEERKYENLLDEFIVKLGPNEKLDKYFF
jgi:hypothetical protein